jgi:hypothetical protein
VREASDLSRKLIDQAHESTKAALGGERGSCDEQYDERLENDPAFVQGKALYKFACRIGRWSRFLSAGRGRLKVEDDFWCTTTIYKRLYFHPPDVPVRVWAVSIQPAGVIWADAEITKVTGRNVMVRYAGKAARLDRKRLWRSWSWWRGVMFVSARSGRVADKLDRIWEERYGGARGGMPPVMQMPLAQAIALLGVPADYSRDDVIAGFRRAAKKAHPDAGGTAEMFRLLVEARDRLLAALGTSAPAPKAPTYAPEGHRVVYRSGRTRSQQGRLGSITPRLA